LARWLAEWEIDDSKTEFWADFWDSPTGAFLAELMWVYFTELLDPSGSPINK